MCSALAALLERDDVPADAKAVIAAAVAGATPAERALVDSEARFRGLFDHMLNGFAWCRMQFEGDQPVDFVYLAVNESFARLTGLGDVTGRRVSEVVPGHREADPLLFERYARVARGGPGETFEVFVEALQMWLAMAVYGTGDDHFVAVFDVITARKEAEAQLRESEAKYRLLVENAQEAVYVVQDGRFQFANRVLGEMTGIASESLLGMPVLGFVAESERERLRGRYFEVLSGAETTQVEEFRAILRAGEERWLRVSAVRIDWQGRPAVLSLASDVTDRKRAERLLQAAVEGTARSVGVEFFQGLAHTVAHALGARLCFVGEVVGQHLRTVAHYLDGQVQAPESWPLRGTPCEAVLRDGVCVLPAEAQTAFSEAAFLRRLGLHSYVGACLYDAAGQPMGVLAVAHDAPLVGAAEAEPLLRICASRASMELQRGRSVANLRNLVTAIDQAGEAIVITDTDGVIEYVNPAFERNTGYLRAEAVGRTPQLLRSGEHDTVFYERLWQTIQAGELWSGRIINRHKDGHLFTEEMTIAPVLNDAGEIARYVAVKREITRQLQLEETLRQAQKMEAVGQLAGGVAHDLNNLLTPILGYTDLVVSDMEASDPRRELLVQVLTASGGARDLVKHLLAFGRRQVLQITRVDLNEVLRRFLPLMRRTLREDVQIRTDLAAEALVVQVDRGQLEQVLLNLAINAQDAMPHGGLLSLRTVARDLNSDRVAAAGGLPRGRYVTLMVGDTGCGMDDETAARVFEPFFTTKGDLGTGLGLATSYGIIKQHNGDIRLLSQPGVGTEFTVLLPAASGACELEPQPTADATVRAHGTVLVAEDEPNVRKLTVRMLQRLGYTVLTAETPEACLALARETPIDVLLTDVVMPGLHGQQLAALVRQRQPGVRVLLASGYARDIVGEDAHLDPGDGFIQKPFELAELARSMAALRGSQAAVAA